MRRANCLLPLLSLLLSCAGSSTSQLSPLPIFGERTLSPNQDTIYHTISSFQLLNQDSVWITNQSMYGKVYVADFFFTSCPTICPIMSKHMLLIYEKYKDNDQVRILSHSIDPDFDQVPVLKHYAEALEIEGETWHFLTGHRKEIYDLALNSYFSVVVEDDQAQGGYLHSGNFLLVDTHQRIRGVYDGTSEESVEVLLKDIQRLLNE